MVEYGVASVAERIVAPALVGRADEVRRLVEAISTRPALVTVEGEAGIGKTRLVEELMRVAPGGRRLVGRCHGIREAFPLGPVIEAVRQVEPELARLPLTGVAGALRPVLPELAGVLPPEPAPLADRVAVRHRVFRALREVLAGVGRLVLVLEDLHWADEQTVELLGYLVSEPPPELAVVLTYRGAEVPPAIPALAARAPAATATTRLTLGPLDPVQTGALAAAILGVDRVSGEFASYLCERTAGLPFAMEEVLALLRARGSLPRRGEQLTRQVLEALEVPSGIRDWVRERVSSLSPAARAVVEAAAVLQVPVPERVLAGAASAGADATTGAGAGAGAGAGDRSAGLAEAVGSGLLTDDRDLLGFRHLLAAQAVYQGLPGVRRRALHTWAASRLTAELHPVPLGQVVHHLWRAGDLAAWSASAIAAADQAVRLGHDQEAVRLLEQVLREAPLDAEQRATVAVRLGRASVHVRPTPQVAELLAEVLATDPPRPVRGQLRFLLAGLLNFLGGDPARQYALYQGAVDDLAGRPDLQAWAMAGLGVPMVPGVPLAEHLEWLRRILALLPEITDPAFRVWLLGKVAMVRIPIGDPQWRPIVDQLRAATGDAPRQSQEVNAYYSVGAAACYGGRHELADQLVQTGLAGAATAESEALAQALRSVAALLDYCRGRWDGLAGRVEALLAELAPGTRTRLDAEVAAAGMALARGDLDGAGRRLGEVTARAEQLGCFDLLPLPVAMQIRLALVRSQPAEAVAAAERVEAVLEPTAVWPRWPGSCPGWCRRGPRPASGGRPVSCWTGGVPSWSCGTPRWRPRPCHTPAGSWPPRAGRTAPLASSSPRRPGTTGSAARTRRHRRGSRPPGFCWPRSDLPAVAGRPRWRRCGRRWWRTAGPAPAGISPGAPSSPGGMACRCRPRTGSVAGGTGPGCPPGSPASRSWPPPG